MIDGGLIFVPEAGDPQLERGVAEVMKKIQSDPKAPEAAGAAGQDAGQ